MDQMTMQTEIIQHMDYEDIPAYGQIYAKFDDYGLESAIDTELGTTQPPSMLTNKIDYRLSPKIISEQNEELYNDQYYQE